MSLLSTISKPKDRAIMATITGEAGMGKTCFAATFPKPIFIRAEDGMRSIPVDQMPDAFPVVKSVHELWAQLGALIHEEHDYKTVVIDSVTMLERLFIQHIVARDPKKPRSINNALGGYGAGFQAVSDNHHRLRKAADLLVDKGMNVIFIAHSDTETIELPDAELYTKYCLRLGKRSVAPYVDDVDMVGHIKLETFTTGDGERKKAISDGTRVLVTYATAANVSKNRLGIEEDLVLKKGENPILKFLTRNEGDIK